MVLKSDTILAVEHTQTIELGCGGTIRALARLEKK